MYPLKFKPILKTLLWGGDKICTYKQITPLQQEIGESWEISGVVDSESVVSNGKFVGTTLEELLQSHGEEVMGKALYNQFRGTFPLLIKFIDANDDLSIQVHPDDALAKKRHNSFGKTEMWYVIDADPGSTLYAGFETQITPAEYEERIQNSTITEVLNKQKVKAGDCFFLPAGRIHSIGKGVFMAEIQQTSTITYRIYDFDRRDKDGNTRELHTELAKDAIDYKVYDQYKVAYSSLVNEPVELVNCPYFTTSLFDITEEMTCDYADLDSFVIFICIKGAAMFIDSEGVETEMKAGETVLIPASIPEITVYPKEEGVKFLEVYV